MMNLNLENITVEFRWFVSETAVGEKGSTVKSSNANRKGALMWSY